MAIVSVRELVEAGVHFGHRISRWNPKMKPFIFGKRNLIHIIDLKETIKGLIRGSRFLARVVQRGEDVLFVGTKRQARNSIKTEAERCGMPYVCERWLGGTLTNFRTITSRVKRLEELETLEETGRMRLYSKKMIARLQRETSKIKRNLEGIRNMKRLPGVLVIVDPHHEKIAVAEARKLGIPTVCLTDTDSNPDLVDIVIPGNDDAIRSILLFVAKMADAVLAGKKLSPKAASPPPKGEAKAEEAAAQTRDTPRRGRRGPGARSGGRGARTGRSERRPGGKTVTTAPTESKDRRSRSGRGRKKAVGGAPKPGDAKAAPKTEAPKEAPKAAPAKAEAPKAAPETVEAPQAEPAKAPAVQAPAPVEKEAGQSES